MCALSIGDLFLGNSQEGGEADMENTSGKPQISTPRPTQKDDVLLLQ